MKALGEGKRTDIKATTRSRSPKAAKPAPTSVDADDPSGLKAGQKLSVTPDDTGKVPVTGTLVGLTADRISIARNDPRVGESSSISPRGIHRPGRLAVVLSEAEGPESPGLPISTGCVAGDAHRSSRRR